jgi:hypothetical protein
LLVDEVLIALGLLMSAGLYTGILLADHPRARAYVRENPGSPFVVAFIALLISAAASFSAGRGDLANELSVYAYFSLLAGVVLQAVAAVRGDRDGGARSRSRYRFR